MKIFKNDFNIEDKKKLEKYLMAFDHGSSAQCFSSLFMWSVIHDFCWEDIEGYLCIEGTLHVSSHTEEWQIRSR